MNYKNIFTKKINVVLIATFCCILWGTAYPSIKIGYELFNISSDDVYSKIVFAGYRFTLAGLMVLSIYKITKSSLKINKDSLKKLLLLGIFQTTLQYTFFYIGLSNTTGVKGAIMNSSNTFFSILLAHIMYKNDKLSFNKVIGCIIGFLGVCIANFDSSILNLNFKLTGEGFVIIAAFFFSISAIYSKNLSKSIDVMLITGYQLFFGGVVLFLIGLSSGGDINNYSFKSISLLIYMAFLSAAAFTLWTTLLKYNKVGSISIYNFLVPIFGVLFSSIFLKENILDVKNIFALIFVCLGIYLVNINFKNKTPIK